MSACSWELEATLTRFLETARQTMGAGYAALGILDRQRLGLECFLTAGLGHATVEAIGAQPRGRGVLGLLIVDPRSLRLDDVTSHELSYGFPPGHPVMHSFLGVPIVIEGEPWGNLYFTEKAGGAFDEADEHAAIALAERAAAAVEQARSRSGKPGGAAGR